MPTILGVRAATWAPGSIDLARPGWFDLPLAGSIWLPWPPWLAPAGWIWPPDCPGSPWLPGSPSSLQLELPNSIKIFIKISRSFSFDFSSILNPICLQKSIPNDKKSTSKPTLKISRFLSRFFFNFLWFWDLAKHWFFHSRLDAMQILRVFAHRVCCMIFIMFWMVFASIFHWFLGPNLIKNWSTK